MPKKQCYKKQAEHIIDKMKKRSMEGYYCESKQEALECVKDLIKPESSIAWGGSMTLTETGIMDDIKESNYILYDRMSAKTPEEARQLYGQIVTADYFLMSSNAITLDGELVNIDGIGNRVACLCHGPQNVIVVVGMNKVCTNVEMAINRVKNVAAPPNAIRLNRSTPCKECGVCADCFAKDCMCCQIVVTRKSQIPNRIKVVLVGEELGY